MNIADLFKRVMQKYDLLIPIPPEVQRELFRTKKATLKHILSANNRYSFFVKSVVTVFYMAKKLGFNLSVKGSRALVGAGSFAAVFLILASLVFIIKPYLYHAPLGEYAVAICAVGDAGIARSGKNKTQLNPADVIRTGDVITTGPDSIVIIQIGKDKMIRIQPGTNIEAASILSSGTCEINLGTGTILAHIRKLRKDESFIIKSATAVAAVHGTAFSVTCRDKGCAVAVKEGRVEVTRLAPLQRIILNAGFAAAVDKEIETRKTTEAERLDIQRVEAVPFQEYPDSLSDAEISAILELVRKNDTDIDEKISRLSAEILPQTIDEIRKKYGRIDMVTEFNGQSYKGAIISRGTTWKILVPGKYIYVPANRIQSSVNIP